MSCVTCMVTACDWTSQPLGVREAWPQEQVAEQAGQGACGSAHLTGFMGSLQTGIIFLKESLSRKAQLCLNDSVTLTGTT